MTTRLASLLAAAALCVSAAPAFAQDWEYGVPPLPPIDAEVEAGNWDDEWDAASADEPYDELAYDDDYDGVRRQEHYEHGERRGRGHVQRRHEQRSRFAYSADQRAEWLDHCRANQYYSSDGRERGAVIGGALGALGGGFAGNRIAGRGDRLAGTLLGAGAGAVAGAAIGSAVGADADRRSRSDYCEEYLARYEDSAVAYGTYGTDGQGFSPYGTPGVMWVRVPIIREKRDCGCEEVIEEEVITPAPRARRVAPRPEKRVRYSR
jgi:hypothetical protein